MSDGEVEVEAPQGYPVLPKEVTAEIGSTKLFNKWSYEDVEIRDISLTCVIRITGNRKREWHANRDGTTEITSKSANPSTSHTAPAGMPSSGSARPSAPSLSASPTP